MAVGRRTKQLRQEARLVMNVPSIARRAYWLLNSLRRTIAVAADNGDGDGERHGVVGGGLGGRLVGDGSCDERVGRGDVARAHGVGDLGDGGGAPVRPAADAALRERPANTMSTLPSLSFTFSSHEGA